MSRVAKKPILVPEGVVVAVSGQSVSVQGPNGRLNFEVHSSVEVRYEGQALACLGRDDEEGPKQAGTARAILNNMVQGVVQPFERKLTLLGVGYRAAVESNRVTLSLGYSHPVTYEVEPGVSVACPSVTEMVVRGIDKQRVGQVAADLRNFRRPEPYKGKGVRYADEVVRLKEAKKK